MERRKSRRLPSHEVLELLRLAARASSSSSSSSSGAKTTTSESPERNSHSQKGRLRHQNWIRDEALAYLRKSRIPTVSNMEQLYKGLQPFKFTEQELIQLLHQLPQALVEIHVLFKDDRFTSQQQEQILQIIKQYTTTPAASHTNDTPATTTAEKSNAIPTDPASSSSTDINNSNKNNNKAVTDPSNGKRNHHHNNSEDDDLKPQSKRVKS